MAEKGISKPNPLRLTYIGPLPRMNRNAPHWIHQRARLNTNPGH